jgi:hypothetical protein
MVAMLETGGVGLAAVTLAPAVDEQPYIGFETALYRRHAIVGARLSSLGPVIEMLTYTCLPAP